MFKITRILLGLIVTFSLLSVSSLALPSEVSAKHKAGHGTTKSKSPALTATRSKNKLSVVTTFSNLTNVKSISYRLTYDSTKGPQGAAGTIKPGKSASLSRTLLLGTCSGKVCTYHNGVKNIKVTADFTLKTGGVVSYEKKL